MCGGGTTRSMFFVMMRKKVVRDMMGAMQHNVRVVGLDMGLHLSGSRRE